MYCSKCGKEINYDSPICVECVEQLREQSTPEVDPAETDAPVTAETPAQKTQDYTYAPSPAPAAENSPVMRGFGMGLTSAILSFVAYIMAVMSVGLIAEGIGGVPLLFLFAIPATVVSILLGISAIKTFSGAKQRPKPIPALVLGISGVSFAGIAAIFDFAALFVAMTI